MRRFQHRPHGSRSGYGPSLKAKLSVYRAFAPDGAEVKTTAHLEDNVALMYIFKIRGLWQASAVRIDRAWGERGGEAGQWVDAEKVR